MFDTYLETLKQFTIVQTASNVIPSIRNVSIRYTMSTRKVLKLLISFGSREHEAQSSIPTFIGHF